MEKVVLIEPQSPGFHVFKRYRIPRLGLPILGAVMKRELDIKPAIYFEETEALNWQEVRDADIVGISAITPTAAEAYGVVRRVKSESKAKVIIGGPHVTFLPEEPFGYGADYVVRGEGEETIIELLNSILGGGELSGIKGLSYLQGSEVKHNPDRERIEKLSCLPWPDLSLIKGFSKPKVVPVMTSRGCPYNCNFCSVTEMFGRKYRMRDTEDVLAELEERYALFPKSTFFFYDDNFTAAAARTKALLGRMDEANIRPSWTAQARVEISKDEEMLEQMRDTGCRFLYIGFESVNPDTLKAYNKSQTVEDIEQAIHAIHRHKIRVHGMFVLGADQDDRSTIRETVEFARRTGIDTVQFLVLTPMPGTAVYRDLCNQGRIFTNDWSKYSGHHVVFHPEKMPAFSLQKEASLKAMNRFYSSWECWKNALSFKWGKMAIKIYAHRGIKKWKSENKVFLKELKLRMKLERVVKKSRSIVLDKDRIGYEKA